MKKAWFSCGLALAMAALLALTAAALSTCGKAPVAQVSGIGGQGSAQTAQPAVETTRHGGQALSETLADLDSLETPAGVDEAVFSALKSALREALLESVGRVPGGAPSSFDALSLRRETSPAPYSSSSLTPAKVASRPPTGEANKVDDLTLTDNGDGTYALTWTYKNVGDYNQDGIVNIMDITPLAVHFNEEADSTNEWIDGNGDAVINIADITPLAANFFCDVAGYEIEGATVGGEFSHFKTLGFPVGAWHAKPLQLAFPFSAGDTGALARFRVVPVDSWGEQGISSNEVELPVSAPEIHSVTPTEWYTGEECTFSAAVSGTRPLNFSWDFGGGAEPNEVTGDGDEVIAEVTLGEPGEYDAELSVSNLYGEDTYPFTLTVTERETWVHTWGGSESEEAEDLAIDEDGNVYLAGYTTTFSPVVGKETVLVMKYTPDGELAWVRTWGGNGSEHAEKIEITDEGELLVVGQTNSFGAGHDDVLFLKYDPDGNLLWQKTWGTGSYETVNDVALDNEGNIYIAGEWVVFGDEPDVLVAKFTADGDCTWAKRWGGSGDDRGKAVAIDSLSQLYVAARPDGDSDDYDMALLKYDAAGQLLWARTWGGDGKDGPTGLTVDVLGNVYLAGATKSFSDGDYDVLLTKWDCNGDVLFTCTWGGSEWDGSAVPVFGADASLYLAAESRSFGPRRGLLLCHEPAGTLLESRAWSGDWSGIESLDWDADGNMYLAGHGIDNLGSWEDAEGSVNWVEGTVGTSEGTEAILEGQEGTPEGIVGSPVGVEDTDTGGGNVLLFKNFPG